ncbi:MAG: fucose 4-O-acetylase-like acetyltransferase [Porticoccaceae bacterium]|jgi:fucose 4-O-acetylase-like acetyltransferase
MEKHPKDNSYAEVSKRIAALDYFRAVSIIVIVAGHSFIFMSWQIDMISEKILTNVVKGGTSLFVFISGFFLCYRYSKGFQLIVFMNSKIKFVILPYLVMTVLTYLFHNWNDIQFLLHQPYLSSMTDALLEHARLLGIYALNGQISFAYWYIPFIFCIFLMSPLFLIYSRANVWLRVILLFVALCVASVVHRPVSNLNVIHSIVYFTPIYFLGINVGVGWEYFRQPIQKLYLIFGSVALGIACLQAYFSDVNGNSHKHVMFAMGSFDYMIWQKAFLSLFLLGLCLKIQHIKFRTLTLFGSTSFAVYFLHAWVLERLSHATIITSLRPDNSILAWVYITVVAFGFSLGIAILTKRFLGRRSRYFIGY